MTTHQPIQKCYIYLCKRQYDQIKHPILARIELMRFAIQKQIDTPIPIIEKFTLRPGKRMSHLTTDEQYFTRELDLYADQINKLPDNLLETSNFIYTAFENMLNTGIEQLVTEMSIVS